MLSERDQGHLKVLSIFHYIYAGISVLFSFLPLFYMAIGFALAFGLLDNSKDEVQCVVGYFIIAISVVAILIGLSISALIAFAGWKLSRHRSWIFCLVVACVECIFFPFGTVLGVFSIIVLLRGSIKEGFAQES